MVEHRDLDVRLGRRTVVRLEEADYPAEEEVEERANHGAALSQISPPWPVTGRDRVCLPHGIQPGYEGWSSESWVPLSPTTALIGRSWHVAFRVWLNLDRRTERAAGVLNIHKHTLQYRLRRVEQLTGRDLARVQDTVDVWLALQALEVIGGDQEARVG